MTFFKNLITLKKTYKGGISLKRIIINGDKKLSGTIKIGGAKNSLVALMPAAILSDGIVTIENVPNIADKSSLLEILNYLNVDIVDKNNKLIINNKTVENKVVTLEYSKKLRASYYFMGVLLAKYKKAEVYMPGGCQIGARPIDIHLEGFEKLGAKIKIEGEKYIITTDELIGTEIPLRFASVGATINIMFAAVKAKGITVIKNAAREVEIINIGKFLNNMGAKITGLGTENITIEGVEKLGDAKISVIPDRIETGTYIILGALLGDNLTIDGFHLEYNKSLITNLDSLGVKYKINNNSITLSKAEDLKPICIKSEVYPGFPTDLGQPMQILLTQCLGESVFEETIYENRMLHVKYLQKMGANIKGDNMKAIINGKTNLVGKEITAKDLRGGAALVLAGLIASGKTTINDVDFILRGYENIINKLTKVGAKIKIEEI